MANSYNKKQVRAEIVALEAVVRRLDAARQQLTPEQSAQVQRLEFLRGLWACRFSNR